MSGSVGRTLFFCLGTGAALGCLFLLFQALRALLRAGSFLTAVLDLLFCAFTGAAVFLCALAVDHGRLRLLQALFQILGGWSAVTALGPLAAKMTGGLDRLSARFAARFRRKTAFSARQRPSKGAKTAKNQEKRGQKQKKAQKNT